MYSIVFYIFDNQDMYQVFISSGAVKFTSIESQYDLFSRRTYKNSSQIFYQSSFTANLINNKFTLLIFPPKKIFSSKGETLIPSFHNEDKKLKTKYQKLGLRDPKLTKLTIIKLDGDFRN